MSDRIRFMSHEGKQILLVDLSYCPAAEVEEILRALPDVVTKQPRGSVLILSDFTGASGALMSQMNMSDHLMRRSLSSIG